MKRKLITIPSPFDAPPILAKGGPGSGNHGHEGRPGERGGSAPGAGGTAATATPSHPAPAGAHAQAPAHAHGPVPSAALHEQTKQLMDQAKGHDHAVTSALQDVVTANGGEMLGLQHRLKTDAGRIAQKMAEKVQMENLTPEQAKNSVYDSLRYTAAFPAEGYTEGVDKLLGKLEAQGVTVFKGKDKNYWPPPPGIYHGMNYVMQTKDGFKFELQFHTRESFDTKQRIHKMYETFRAPGTSREQRLALWNDMNKAWGSVPVPPGVKRLGKPMLQEQA